MGRVNRDAVVVYCLFLITGAIALVYQSAWNRELTLVFGASRAATSIVLAAFMIGLALGGALGGRWSSRVKNPLKLYGWLEIAVAVFAVLFPYFLQVVDLLYISIAKSVGDVTVMLSIARFCFAFGLLLLPTVCMGATLPVLVQFLVSNQSQMAQRMPLLYGVNTLGAAGGALLAGFVILPALGLFQTQLYSALLNGLVGIAAIGYSHTMQSASTTSDTTPDKNLRPTDDALALRLVFWGAAVCGFCSLGMEVMWTRALAVALGATSYNFTLMLAAFLSGIALGGLFESLQLFKEYRLSTRFGFVLLFIGASAGVACQLVPEVPAASLQLNQWIYGHFSGVRPMAGFALSFLLMAAPAFLFGMAFPMAAEARSLLQRRFGASTGESAFINTVGAALGALAAGYVLVPQLGLQTSLLLVSTIPALYGFLVLCWAFKTVSSKGWLAFCLAIVGALGIISVGFQLPQWDYHRLSAFRNNVGAAYLNDDGAIQLDAALADSTIVYYEEGADANVSVVQSSEMRSLVINGKTVATDSKNGLSLQKLMGHLPCFVHPAPKSVLVIGLGAGCTVGAAAIHPGVDSVRLVEIEPAVLGGAAAFDYANSDALNQPTVTVTIQDGRNHLRTTTETYDVITADPIHPWAAGSTFLYTYDYYKDAAARLNPGGVMAQWLPLYELSERDIDTLVRTFTQAFPNAMLWQTYYDSILIGSNESFSIQVEEWAQRFNDAPLKDDLLAIDLDHAGALLAMYVADQDGLNELSQGALINTDDNLHVEFSSPYHVGSNTLVENIERLSQLRFQDQCEACLLRQYDQQWLGLRRVDATLTLRMARMTEEGRSISNQQAIETYLALKQEANSLRIRREIATTMTSEALRLLREDESSKAIELFETAAAEYPFDGKALNQLAVLMAQDKQFSKAKTYIEEAVTRSPRSSQAWMNRGSIYEVSGDLQRAEASYKQALLVRPGYHLAHKNLAQLYVKMGRRDLALIHYEKAAKNTP